MLRNTNKGITLIALVITIIVMLILVAVTISMAINGGLFGYAGKAAGDTQNAIDAEQELGDGKIKIDDKWYNNIDDYIDGKPIEDGSGEGVGPEGGTQIEISIAGEKVTTVPLPSEDFEHVEGTIDEGYVIRHKTDGNEFVWVPVDKNQKITLKITSDKDIKAVAVQDPQMQTIFEVMSEEIGKNYSNTNISPTINGVYTVIVLVDDEILQKELIVTSLYAMDPFVDWYVSDECSSYPTIPGKWNVTYSNKVEFGNAVAESMLNADLETAYQEGFSLEKLIGLYLTAYYADRCEDLADYTESINKNGGFYIGRYEAGVSIENINVKNETPVSKEGYYVATPTFVQISEIIENVYKGSNFTISIPTNKDWDRTLRWFNETGAKSLKELAGDSTNWGNYLNSEFEITKGKYGEIDEWGMGYEEFIEVTEKYKKIKDMEVLLTTGATKRNCVNNVFDLAGNALEWVNSGKTQNGDIYRGVRGGHNAGTGSEEPSTINTNFSNYTSYLNLGFRYIIYLD